MVPVLRVLVYYPVRETRMAKALSSGETSVSRPKKRYVGTLLVRALVRTDGVVQGGIATREILSPASQFLFRQ